MFDKGGLFWKISVRELHRQLQFMGDADCQKRYGLAWVCSAQILINTPTLTLDGLGRTKIKNSPNQPTIMPFCIALINLAVALMRSPQHKTFRILNVSVKISRPPHPGFGLWLPLFMKNRAAGPIIQVEFTRGLFIVCVCVNNL